MASLAACNWHKPLCVVPCLSWSTASNVFTSGVMAQSINWDVLETQYFSDGKYRERLAKMVTIVDDAFLAGQRFAQHFNKSILKLRDDIQDTRSMGGDTENNNNKNNNDNNSSGEIVNLMDINRTTNTLNISPALLVKLLSKEKCTLTKLEINELNEKICEAQNKWRAKKEQQQQQKQPPTTVTAGKDEPMDALQVLRIANGIMAPPLKTTTDSLASLILGSTTKLMRYILPKRSDGATAASSISTATDDDTKAEPKEWWERESLQFMRGVMDECTHLKNFSVPLDTELIISVCATDDGYIPREDCMSLEEIWPGAEVRYLDAGHVSAYVLHQKIFRSAIIETFERARRKYPELLPTSSTADDDANKQYLTPNTDELKRNV